MTIGRLFVIRRSAEWPVPGNHLIEAGPGQQQFGYECICTDARAVDDTMFTAKSVWHMQLCNESHTVFECRPATTSTLSGMMALLGNRIESPEEGERESVVRMAVNRRTFLLSNSPTDDLWRTVEGTFLDVTDAGVSHCVSLRVEMMAGCYGELPDYAAQLELSYRDCLAMGHELGGLFPSADWFAIETVEHFSALGRQLPIQAPAFLPIDASKESEFAIGGDVLQLVSPLSTEERKYNARLIRTHPVRISSGDNLTRTVRWNAGDGEKQLSIIVAKVI